MAAFLASFMTRVTRLRAERHLNLMQSLFFLMVTPKRGTCKISVGKIYERTRRVLGGEGDELLDVKNLLRLEKKVSTLIKKQK